MSSHLELLHPFQPVQVRHQSDSIFERSQEFHLELHHLPEVSKQNVQLTQTESVSLTDTTLKMFFFFFLIWYLILCKEALLLQRC